MCTATSEGFFVWKYIQDERGGGCSPPLGKNIFIFLIHMHAPLEIDFWK